jgi:queuine tRNA-ribosyltransferase
MGVGTPSRPDRRRAARRGHVRLRHPHPLRPHRPRLYQPGILNIRNASMPRTTSPLDPECDCPACTRHSRGYLLHLFKAGEMLGPMLLTWHNIRYYQT